MGTKYSILQVFYKAFYEYSIRHSTGYSIVYSVNIYRWYFRRYSIRYSYMQLCNQLGIYKVYNGAQGYVVEWWAHGKGRGLESG